MMTIIEVNSLENGSHRNQTGHFTTIPVGWAIFPDSLPHENFPFGTVTAEVINGVLTVTNWMPAEIPAIEEPKPEPTPVEKNTANIAYLSMMTGIDLPQEVTV